MLASRPGPQVPSGKWTPHVDRTLDVGFAFTGGRQKIVGQSLRFSSWPGLTYPPFASRGSRMYHHAPFRSELDGVHVSSHHYDLSKTARTRPGSICQAPHRQSGQWHLVSQIELQYPVFSVANRIGPARGIIPHIGRRCGRGSTSAALITAAVQPRPCSALNLLIANEILIRKLFLKLSLPMHALLLCSPN